MASTPDPTASTDVPVDRAREARRRSRAEWPIHRYALGEEPGDDLSEVTTVAERFAMVWLLTLRAWRLSGKEMPDYDRRDMPGRVIRARDGARAVRP